MVNVLIADDHDLVRDTIVAFLNADNGFNVLGAATLDAALDLARGMTPMDVIVLDYNMPGMNGLEGLKRTQTLLPHARVALMSGVAGKTVGLQAMECGAAGFLSKSMSAKSMVHAIRLMAQGEAFFPFGLDDPVEHAQDPVLATLTRRERETLQRLQRGLSNKEIGRDLGLQEVTVKLHVKTLMAKLGVKNRTQAALFANERGFH